MRGVGAVFSASLHVTAVETGIVKHSSRWEAGVFQGNVIEAGANIISFFYNLITFMKS